VKQGIRQVSMGAMPGRIMAIRQCGGSGEVPRSSAGRSPARTSELCRPRGSHHGQEAVRRKAPQQLVGIGGREK
jgi:hypothetical protein